MQGLPSISLLTACLPRRVRCFLKGAGGPTAIKHILGQGPRDGRDTSGIQPLINGHP